MKGRVTVLGEIAGRRAAALIEGGALDDLLVDGPDPALAPEAIHRAKVLRAVKGQGGAFVELAGGRQGFLRGGGSAAPGRWLTVQVTGHAEPGKAMPVTTRLLFKGRTAILTPGAPGVNVSRGVRGREARERLEALAAGLSPEGGGLILRTAASEAGDSAILDEVAALEAAARAVLGAEGQGAACLRPGPDSHARARRDWEAGEVDGTPGAFERHEVGALLAAARSPEVPLGSARMTVEPTRALVAVDIDTGGDTSPAAGLKANIAAMRALPRALRVRGLGGQVVVDMAPMPKRDRRQVETALKSALKTDPVETAVVGWTPLGHLELQRQRARLPLSEAPA